MIPGVSGRALGRLLLCTFGILGACKESAPPAATPAVQTAKQPPPDPGTWYRARLVFDGIGDLPFFLHVPPVGKAGKAHVVNGEETVDFQAEWRDNEITITGPWTYT